MKLRKRLPKGQMSFALVRQLGELPGRVNPDRWRGFDQGIAYIDGVQGIENRDLTFTVTVDVRKLDQPAKPNLVRGFDPKLFDPKLLVGFRWVSARRSP